jgi:hypothetical protein
MLINKVVMHINKVNYNGLVVDDEIETEAVSYLVSPIPNREWGRICFHSSASVNHFGSMLAAFFWNQPKSESMM